MRNRAAAGLVAVAVAIVGAVAPAAADPPVASFGIDPAEPHTGDTVVFTSNGGGTITSRTWDLDGDGRCNDASGPRAQRSFAVPGTYIVKLCVDGPEGEASQARRITILNRPPNVSFTLLPVAPRAGQPVTFVSTAVDPDGPLTTLNWDLNGDGSFADATGVAASWTYAHAGTIPVSLRVTDASGAVVTATLSLHVARAALKAMVPPPIVRLSGRVTAWGFVVTRLIVKAGRHTRVEVRCGGGRRHGCRFHRVRRARHSRVWRVRRAEGWLSAGTTVKVLVRRARTLGKFTRFRVRAGRPPERLDSCLRPHASRPGRCPR